NHQYYISAAEAKALGLLTNTGALDGSATFTSRLGFDYDSSNGISPGKYDFFGTVVHEFTEIMGRTISDGGGNNVQEGPANGSYPLDLFHYSAPGARSFDGTHKGYFSIDGKAMLLPFNTNPNGDWGDWASGADNDSFLAFADSGVVNKVSKTDLREMDIL